MENSLRFGEFELFPERFELCRAGTPLRLERKPMEMLILLTVGRGRVITRLEIAAHLWGSDVFVDTEHGINTAVRKLRQALKDDPENPRFIQTVPRSGYRFIAPVSAFTASAALNSSPIGADPAATATRPYPRFRSPGLVAALGLTAACLLVILAVSVRYRSRAAVPTVEYEQLTDLTDAAVAPAISPDGQTVAFIRGDTSFASTGPIYVKAVPNGEDRLVTSDQRPKYGLAFSPDGSRIAYTVFGKAAFATYTVSVFGGDPVLLLNNAAGLSWVAADQLLFSEVHAGVHLGVVTGPSTGADTHDVYFPAHQRGMAHESQVSPDHHWLLVVEMDSNGHWAPCRLVAFAGQSGTRVIGPDGACTAAGWSADGQWMYFIATVAGQSHLWRQHFPTGAPQQITSGTAEEDGLAVDTNSNTLITSIGSAQSALWIHDNNGERALSSAGEVLNEHSPPLFRQNDTVLYYLLRRKVGPPGAELRRVEVRSGKVEVVVPGVTILDYDVSPDGGQVVFSTANPAGAELWLAPTDHASFPVRLGVQGASFPHFGPGGRILFQFTEGSSNFLEQVDWNGLGRSKLVPYPIHDFQGVSPQGHWATALVSEFPGNHSLTLVAIPFDGSRPTPLCAGYCAPRWSSAGASLFIPVDTTSAGDAGQSLVFPVGPNERLPDLPGEGLDTFKGLPGTAHFPRADLIPGKDPEHFAFVRKTVQRNLFRVTLN